MGCNWCFDPILVITSVGSSALQKNLRQLDQPTLVIFLVFFEKTTGSSANFLSPDSNGQGLTYWSEWIIQELQGITKMKMNQSYQIYF